MKYLKLYEQSDYHELSFKTWIEMAQNGVIDHFGISQITRIDCRPIYRRCAKITNLKGLEILPNLIHLNVGFNNLKSLEGIEILLNLEELYCPGNELKKLDEIKNLKNLKILCSAANPFDYPISKYLVDKFVDIYHDQFNRERCFDKLGSYEFQKEFIEEHPEKIIDLIPIGFDEKIEKEYHDLIQFFST